MPVPNNLVNEAYVTSVTPLPTASRPRRSIPSGSGLQVEFVPILFTIPRAFSNLTSVDIKVVRKCER